MALVSKNDFGQKIRESVLAALDKACGECGVKEVLDQDLPELFTYLETLETILWDR